MRLHKAVLATFICVLSASGILSFARDGKQKPAPQCQTITWEEARSLKSMIVAADFVSYDKEENTVSFQNQNGKTFVWTVSPESTANFANLLPGDKIGLEFSPSTIDEHPFATVSDFAQQQPPPPPCQCHEPHHDTTSGSCMGSCSGACPKGYYCKKIAGNAGFQCACGQ